jgi:hypothetical protein
LILWKWPFFKEALSENGVASSKRVGGFILIETVVICEMYHTMKKGEFDLNHLIAFCCMICLCWGIATVTQVVSVWKGTPAETNKEPEPSKEIQ